MKWKKVDVGVFTGFSSASPFQEQGYPMEAIGTQLSLYAELFAV
jgi:hypothetical protein